MSPRNLSRLNAIFVTGIGTIETTSAGDETLRAYLIGLIGEVDAAIVARTAVAA